MRVEVRNREGAEAFVKERDGKQRNAYCVTFQPKISGCYTISVMINGKHIHGSPFRRTFVPGLFRKQPYFVPELLETTVNNVVMLYTLRVTSQTSYSPEYITPTQKKIMITRLH